MSVPARAVLRFAPLFLLAGLVAVTVLPDATEAKIDPDRAAKELIALTNLSRTSNGLSSLPADARLNRIAESRSEDMINRRYFDHYIPPDKRTVVDVMESLGVRFRAGSENIAWNNALDFTTVPLASDDFMNSLKHRANVLNGRWHRLGAGVADGDGRKMYTVVFIELPGEPGAPIEIKFIEPPDDAVAPARPEPRSRVPRPSTGDEAVQVASAPTGVMDSLVGRSLRLFLSL